MKVLFSAVGDSDPIRCFHDGPLVHISRKYRPDKIIILHSEKTNKRRERLLHALHSISDDYHPIIIEHPEVLSDNEIHLFDKMYASISDVLKSYLNKEDEFILNLSSGTPQVNSALFVINRLNDINVKAVQVPSPGKSNEGVPYDNIEDIVDLIELNEDNSSTFLDRNIEDTSEKFEQALLKRTARNFIENFDYGAALGVLNKLFLDPPLKKVRSELVDIVEANNKQDIPKRLAKRKIEETAKKILNAFLIIDLQQKRGNISEGFVRIKSLLEFILTDFINNYYPNDLAILDEKKGNMIGIGDLSKILYNHREFSLLNEIKPIRDINSSRNKIVHSLDPISKEDIKNLSKAQDALKKLILKYYSFDRELFKFYEKINIILLENLL
ncbi:MAG: type III-A CRISPR-associated protein Csm6 [Streptococcus sp.]|nr:type III-A CRISPR-associated protein Csm6 [Streptococcus sp.]